ncbi:MAG: hypothetical protein LBQ89_05190 [Treponema sp.]|jgi:hypothetical protein|nr:hypothetical protein [Treponema sp.]
MAKGNEMGYLGLLIPMMALSIPIIAIVLSHKGKAQKYEIEKMKLQKEILELELEKQNSKIKLLEEENKNLDRLINR